MNASLANKIDRFLKERRKNGEGYAPVTHKDIQILYEIIQKLIDLKCPNSTPTIDFELRNLKYQDPICFLPTKRIEHAADNSEYIRILGIHTSNANIAVERIDRLVRGFQSAEQSLAELEKEEESRITAKIEAALNNTKTKKIDVIEYNGSVVYIPTENGKSTIRLKQHGPMLAIFNLAVRSRSISTADLFWAIKNDTTAKTQSHQMKEVAKTVKTYVDRFNKMFAFSSKTKLLVKSGSHYMVKMKFKNIE